MSYFFVKKSLFLLIVIILFSCNQDRKLNSIEKRLPNYEVDNTELKYIAKANLVKLDTVIVSKATSYKTGGSFSGFYKIGNNILVVDRDASEISCLNPSGDRVWIPIPPSPGIDRYTVIGTIDVVQKDRRVYIEDKLNRKVDVFDFDGAYIETLLSKDAFMDFAAIGRDEFLFDITEGTENINDDGFGKRFAYRSNKGISYVCDMLEEINHDAIATNNSNRFNRISGTLFHRMPYEDLLYSINSNIEVNPILKFSFKNDSKFVDVFRNQSVDYVWGELDRLNYPDPFLVILEKSKNNFYSIFRQNKKMHFTQYKNMEQLIVPSQYLLIDGIVVKSPMYFHEGKFYHYMYRYEYDYMQKVYTQNMSTDQSEKGLQELRETKGDNDEIMIFSFEFE